MNLTEKLNTFESEKINKVLPVNKTVEVTVFNVSKQLNKNNKENICFQVQTAENNTYNVKYLVDARNENAMMYSLAEMKKICSKFNLSTNNWNTIDDVVATLQNVAGKKLFIRKNKKLINNIETTEIKFVLE